MQRLARLPKEKRDAFLESLPPRQRLVLRHDWRAWARPNQLAPKGDWFCWLIKSGRGFGKTRIGAEWVIERVRQGYRRIALIGETKADVRDTMIEVGESSIMKIAPPWARPTYEPSKRRLIWPNGAVATAYSGDAPDQLRGPAHDTAWVDELAKFKYAQDTWDQMEFGLRVGNNPKVLCTTTPRPIPIIKALVTDPRVVVTSGSTYDNIDNLAPAFAARIRARYEGTRLGRQELHGEILDDNPDALWTRENLEANRVVAHPALVRVVIGVDPAVTASDSSDETGIVAAALGEDDLGYILGDYSLRNTPAKWARAVVTAYNKHKADRVVGEVNNGGDLVEANIRTVDMNISYKSVHASRGKYVRAEPIAAVYEQNRIKHVGQFATLEDQMCEWSPKEDDYSPDRLDALVWAVTDLGLTEMVPKVYSTRDDEPPEYVQELQALEDEIAAIEKELD